MSKTKPTIWTPAERKVLDRLTSPYAIQFHLDHTPYSPDPIYRSPLIGRIKPLFQTWESFHGFSDASDKG
jgi:hypothetical protein